MRWPPAADPRGTAPSVPRWRSPGREAAARCRSSPDRSRIRRGRATRSPPGRPRCPPPLGASSESALRRTPTASSGAAERTASRTARRKRAGSPHSSSRRLRSRREELRRQVAVRRRDLDAVQPGLGRVRSRLRVAGDDGRDFVAGEGARLDVEAQARHGRRCERRRARRARDLLPATMEQLDEERGPCGLTASATRRRPRRSQGDSRPGCGRSGDPRGGRRWPRGR